MINKDRIKSGSTVFIDISENGRPYLYGEDYYEGCIIKRAEFPYLDIEEIPKNSSVILFSPLGLGYTTPNDSFEWVIKFARACRNSGTSLEWHNPSEYGWLLPHAIFPKESNIAIPLFRASDLLIPERMPELCVDEVIDRVACLNAILRSIPYYDSILVSRISKKLFGNEISRDEFSNVIINSVYRGDSTYAYKHNTGYRSLASDKDLAVAEKMFYEYYNPPKASSEEIDSAWKDYYTESNTNHQTFPDMKCYKCGKEIKGRYFIHERSNHILHRNESDEVYLYHSSCMKRTKPMRN